MNGMETKDEQDRCQIWDVIFKRGPLSTSDLKDLVGMTARRIASLTEHEWFVNVHGLVYIANVDGARRTVPALALAG